MLCSNDCSSSFEYVPCDKFKVKKIDISPSIGKTDSVVTEEKNPGDSFAPALPQKSGELLVFSNGVNFDISSNPNERGYSERLANVVLDSEQRQLFVSLGHAQEVEGTGHDGIKQDVEEQTDCGFACDVPCKPQDNTLKTIRQSFWWLFFLMTTILIINLDKENR
jgi:hypothetical protein